MLTRYPLSIHFHRIRGQKLTKFTKWKYRSNFDEVDVAPAKNWKITKFTKWQKLIQRLYPNHMHILRPWRKLCKVSKKVVLKLYEELRSQGTHCLYTFIINSEVRKWQKFTNRKKVTKIKARIISKSHAHLQTMEKTCAKFQNDQYKIVWGVALTRYPLSIHWGWKMT